MEVIVEFPLAGFGEPERHDAFLREVGDLTGVGFDVAVGEEGKRSGFAGMMAGRAGAKDDWREIAIEGDRAVCGGIGGVAGVREFRSSQSKKGN